MIDALRNARKSKTCSFQQMEEYGCVSERKNKPLKWVVSFLVSFKHHPKSVAPSTKPYNNYKSSQPGAFLIRFDSPLSSPITLFRNHLFSRCLANLLKIPEGNGEGTTRAVNRSSLCLTLPPAPLARPSAALACPKRPAPGAHSQHPASSWLRPAKVPDFCIQ